MVIKMTKRSEVNNVKVIKIKKEYIWIIIKKYAEVKLSESAPLYQYSPILINTGVPYMIFFFYIWYFFHSSVDWMSLECFVFASDLLYIQ